MSKFVTEALDEALQAKKIELEQEYIEAAQDPTRDEAMRDWSALETEGWE